MDEFFIRPAVEGARLHDPITKDPLAAEGETKPRNTYWLKCLARGDVIESDGKSERGLEDGHDPVVREPGSNPVVDLDTSTSI